MDEATIENIYRIAQLENNPFDLNRVTHDQLNQIPLLSLEEAIAIADFLEKNRPIFTVFELRNVPNLEFKTVERIISFFYVGDSKIQEQKIIGPEILQYGRHELQFRLDKTLTPRAGYSEFSDSILNRYPNRKYRGEDFYHSLRYSFRYRNKVQIGFTAEKDAGEPFFKQGYPKGYDHYGLHLIARDIGRLKALALGDFRLSFGQGLVLNNDFMVSKAWGTENIVRRTQIPKRHFSTAESGFFRGAALVTDMGNFTLTSFYSNKKIDANLSKEGDITSFKTDGLHRTLLEIDKKKNVREEVVGANINYRKPDTNRCKRSLSYLQYYVQPYTAGLQYLLPSRCIQYECEHRLFLSTAGIHHRRGDRTLKKRIGRRAAYPTVSPLFQSLLRAPSPILSNILQCPLCTSFFGRKCSSQRKRPVHQHAIYPFQQIDTKQLSGSGPISLAEIWRGHTLESIGLLSVGFLFSLSQLICRFTIQVQTKGEEYEVAR